MKRALETLIIAAVIALCGCSLIASFKPGNQQDPTDGDADGDGDGDADGDSDGDADTDGDADGDADGDSDGDADGDSDGDADGDSDGDCSNDPWFEAAGYEIEFEDTGDESHPDPATTFDYEPIDGSSFIDTTDCNQTAGSERYAELGRLDDSEVCVFYVRNFTIRSGTTVTVTGDYPLVVVASGTITINGTIYSAGDPPTPDELVYYPSAGGGLGGENDTPSKSALGVGCASIATGGGNAATATLQGGGGGAGIGIGGDGGCHGGEGGIAASCDVDGPHLIGGSGGGAGGISSSESRGGHGGGALSFSAALEITIGEMGSINVSGGNGGDASIENGGGGGGGGGTVILDAPVVTIAGNIDARGGYGGGEYTPPSGRNPGGAGGGYSTNLDGGTVPDCQPGEIGYGGGGGAGVIYIRTRPGGAPNPIGGVSHWLPEWRFEDRCVVDP